VIFDTLGVSTFGKAKARLTDTGRYVCPVLTLPLLGAMLQSRLLGRRRALFAASGLQSPKILRAHLAHLLAMVEAGTMIGCAGPSSRPGHIITASSALVWLGTYLKRMALQEDV
jgi:hypothetical protein